MADQSIEHLDQLMGVVSRIAHRPLSSETLRSTWNPPDWEEIVEWHDEDVSELRRLLGVPIPGAMQPHPLPPK